MAEFGVWALVVAATAIGFILGRRVEETRSRRASQEADRERAAMNDRFEVLAQQILDQNTSKMATQNEKNLTTILNPLKDKIRDFEKRVEENYGNEAKERFALQKEIQRLMELNLQMGQEAASLTKALKGDVKSQGAWGEMVLERILESSGLRDGYEFTRQGQGLDLRNEDGKLFKPDIVIQLPDEKHIIIDAKVSLVAYERWISAASPELRVRSLREHIESIMGHIKGLSEKHYHALEQVRSPDFVLLFMPIEGAFSAAIQEQDDLFQFAWDRKIVIVSPTTLLATLRTVAAIWKHEKQSKNALEIARQGGALYDEFVRFMEDVKDIGRALTQTQAAYDSTLKRLSFGKGNLVGRVEKLRELGAKAKRQLDHESQDPLALN